MTTTNTPLPTVVSDKQITVTLPSGEPKSVRIDDDALRFHEVLNAIRDGLWDEVPGLIDVQTAIKQQYSANGFEVRHEYVYVNGEKVPESLSKRILTFAKNRLPVKPLLKFWNNLNENPSFHSVQQLHAFLEANDHPITDDGRFVAYRMVRGDFMDKHTGTMDNSPGKIVKMKRNQVDENPNQTCSHGLHVANYQYASAFGSGSDKLLMVYVNPRDVVAVPTDYSGAKMRVCEFYVVKEIVEEVKGHLVEGAEEPDDDDVDGDSVDEETSLPDYYADTEDDESDYEEEDFEEEEDYEDDDDDDDDDDSEEEPINY